MAELKISGVPVNVYWCYSAALGLPTSMEVLRQGGRHSIPEQ